MAYNSQYEGKRIDEAVLQATDKLPTRVSEAELDISTLKENKADVNAVPKKLSQLTDDIGYETKEDALAKLTKAKAYTDELKFDLEIGNVTVFSAETDLGGNAIHETYATKAELNAAIGGTKVVSIHDNLASIVPADGEQYIIKYHDMPAYAPDAEAEDGKVPVITDTIRYRAKIGDGVTNLAELPFNSSHMQAGEGNGAVVQIDPTYNDGEGNVFGYAKAPGELSSAFGMYTVASGPASSAFNYHSQATGKRSFACGYKSLSQGEASFSANAGQAIGGYSAAFGTSSASGTRSFASGQSNKANGKFSHAEGESNTAAGQASHCEGKNNTVVGGAAHVEGYNNIVNGAYGHAEGLGNQVDGEASHAGGKGNNVSGNYSFVMGQSSIVEGASSGTIGESNVVKANSSFAVGNANQIGSQVDEHAGCFVAGNHNKVANNNLTALGRYNNSVPSAPLVVGWGAGEDSRNNILELLRTGVLIVRTSYQTPEGSEAALQLGDTKLTETQLQTLLKLIDGES